MIVVAGESRHEEPVTPLDKTFLRPSTTLMASRWCPAPISWSWRWDPQFNSSQPFSGITIKIRSDIKHLFFFFSFRGTIGVMIGTLSLSSVRQTTAIAVATRQPLWNWTIPLNIHCKLHLLWWSFSYKVLCQEQVWTLFQVFYLKNENEACLEDYKGFQLLWHYLHFVTLISLLLKSLVCFFGYFLSCSV